MLFMLFFFFFFVSGGVRRQREQELSPWFSHPLGAFTAFAARPRSTDRLINPSMRCSTWMGNDLTKLNRQVQLWVCPRFELPTPHLCISYTGREPVFLLSFIPSASCRSDSFTILSPSPLRGVETPQQVQATSDRSRISTKACSPITCVTGCATKSQLVLNCCCKRFRNYLFVLYI